jgi:transglutaminase-like putative cysteine protease
MTALRSLLIAVPLAVFSAPAAAEPAAPPKKRTFQFTYAGTITDLKPGQTVRVWLPVPPSNDDQDVTILTEETPSAARVDREPVYGNRILYFQSLADAEGKVPFKVVYRVTRREVKGESSKETQEDMARLARLLKPDAKVPIDGKPLELLKDKPVPENQMEAARLLYDVVNNHMRYSKEGTGWGNGDSVWACESRHGNCSDFHSLFISLARSQKIPSVFEIGFPLPEKRGAGDIGGYHCWAKFKAAGKGWIPVDISEANKHPEMKGYYFGNLTEDRIAFSTGRDLELVPRQDGPPLNFFVHPYAEVDGKALPKEKIKPVYSFKDE